MCVLLSVVGRGDGGRILQEEEEVTKAADIYTIECTWSVKFAGWILLADPTFSPKAGTASAHQCVGIASSQRSH